jgi:adenosylcobinamide kinase/adenosylcobinamide-phosphate guanylyltransferase
MKKITFIIGGARSGKSLYGVSLARRYQGKRAFIATAEPFDNEMKERIRAHQKERGDAFDTVEEPIDLKSVLEALPCEVEIAVIDCLSVWLGNLMHSHRRETTKYPEVELFLDVLGKPPCDLIVISNEVGMSVVPNNAMARLFRDLCGWLNQRVAEKADCVIQMVSGIPVFVKGDTG